MELQLGLALTNQTFDAQKSFKNKRSFEEAFGNLQKMPLLLWSGQPNEEDDDPEGQKKRNSPTINEEEDAEEKRVVGWPPIQSWRKKLLNHHDHRLDQVGLIDNNYVSGFSSKPFNGRRSIGCNKLKLLI